tara:strand:- start:230 stop:520 length:291 start_codon:yes stop_codon:yes gene_type:complete
MSSSITLIECNSTTAAQSVVSDVEGGELWGVGMGTTSKASAYSNFALVMATETRTLALLESVPDETKFDIRSSLIDADSFSESDVECKTWFLRGML